MSRVLNHAQQTWNRIRCLAVSLIAAGTAAPALASTGLPGDLTAEEWRTVLLIGFVVLLGIGIVLKVREKSLPPVPVWPTPAQPHRHTIGEDRPNAYH